MSKAKYERVLLKLSGESFSGDDDYGINVGVLTEVAHEIKKVTAMGRFDANISQLTPLFNMNTLVVVLLGLWIFKEHQHVRPLPLLLGAGMVVLGAVLVARA